MPKPLVAVVGRPNVGKSTFFNKMTGQRIAIVEDVPGVTRDRIYADVEWQNTHFTLIDTGGIDPNTQDILLAQMRRQAELAMEMADVILFMVDGRTGMTSDDEDVANLLRRTHKPVLLVVNKVDHIEMEDSAYAFYELGMGTPMAVSSANLLGLGDLLDAIVELLPKGGAQEEDTGKPIQVAVVGKPNVGKSTLVNRLLGQERVMVSDIPGTTRDAIDTDFVFEGQPYTIIDTAGIRRKRSIEDASLERYSVLRSIGAIRRCDVALILIDAQQGVTEQDAKIAGLVHEEGRAAVIVVNKWDALEKQTGTLEQFQKNVREQLKFVDYAPILFISAATGQRTAKVLATAKAAYEQSCKRVGTGVLNDVLADAQAVLQPPSAAGRRLKLYYATQQAICPPTFIFFVNDEKLVHFSYERFLENHFRKAFGFEGTPLRLIFRPKQKEK